MHAPAGIAVHPADAERFADVKTLLQPSRPDAPTCWCLAYRLSSHDFNALTGPERPEVVRDLCGRTPAPGVLAYIEDEPVGWCALGPRPAMARLERSRTIPKVDDRPVWSVVCFVVRAGFRRRGVTRALLDGGIRYAESQGATTIEAYPVDTGGTRINSTLAYVGTTELFEAAGFDRVLETSARSGRMPRWLMRLELPAD